MAGIHEKPPHHEICVQAREESIRIACFHEEQKQLIKSAYLGEQRQLLGVIRKTRRDREDRWVSKLQENPLGRDWRYEDDQNEELQILEARSNSRRQGGETRRNQELYMECLDRANGNEQAEGELAELRAERRRLLERQKQLKTALSLKRRSVTGNIARNCKALLQVADEKGYGRVRQAKESSEMSRGQSLPNLSATQPSVGVEKTRDRLLELTRSALRKGEAGGLTEAELRRGLKILAEGEEQLGQEQAAQAKRKSKRERQVVASSERALSDDV